MAQHRLRPYQDAALTSILDFYMKGEKKVLLHLDTGAGKTTVFCEILKRSKAKGKNAIMVVKGRKLVKQASERLNREFVPHGVLMAGHPLYKPEEQIQICSIDTLRARKLRPKAHLIVIDEAHLATSPSYQEFCESYKDAYFLPVTATPYTTKSLSHLANVSVRPIDFDGLVDEGYLVPPRYFAPSAPDLSKVSITQTAQGKDYNNSQLEKAMSSKAIVGDIANKWLKLGENRPTICFAVNIRHSKTIVESFRSVGVRAVHVDANTPDSLREKALVDLEKGNIQVISNVGILSLGVDIPCASCIISARPTQSVNLYLQQMGRGTRLYPGKEDFIILDHGGNVLRHGFINREREVNLKDTKFKRLSVPVCSSCPECFTVFEGNECHYCGYKKEIKPKEESKEEIECDLVEVTTDYYKMIHEQLLSTKKANKYNQWWPYHELKKRFGERIARRFYPTYGHWKK